MCRRGTRDVSHGRELAVVFIISVISVFAPPRDRTGDRRGLAQLHASESNVGERFFYPDSATLRLCLTVETLAAVR